MNSNKLKVLESQYVTTVKTLMTILETRNSKDTTIYSTKNKINMVLSMSPLIVINKIGTTMALYADEIRKPTIDTESIMKRLLALSGDELTKNVKHIISVIMTTYDGMDNDDRADVHEKVRFLLDGYIEMQLLTYG